MDSPTTFGDLNSQRVKRGDVGYTTTKPPTAQIMVVQQHHHHYHQVIPATTVSEVPTRRSGRLQQQQQHHKAPAALFAGDKSKKFSDDFTRSSKPIGAAYTYNWVMWRTFGCSTLLRCTAGWFCLFFACCGILFILWLFGILWICVFIPGFCEIRS